jgi:hypothetical protein
MNERAKPKEREKEKQGSVAIHGRSDWRLGILETKGKGVKKTTYSEPVTPMIKSQCFMPHTLRLPPKPSRTFTGRRVT